MKTKISACIAVLASFAASVALPASAAVLAPAELFQRASPGVWVVVARDDQNRVISLGSAVVIGQNRAITNCHVLGKASSVTLQRDHETHAARLEYPDTESDLCQLYAEGLPGEAPKIAPTTTLQVGQKVYAIGTPRGLEQSLSDGLISSLRRNRNGAIDYIQITAPISPGSSGGGLYDEEGRLIGITTALVGGVAQNLNFARPADWIASVPAKGRIALTEYAKQDHSVSAVASTSMSANAPTIRASVPAPSSTAYSQLQPSQGSTPNVTTSASRRTGQDTYGAENLAKSQACTTHPLATLVAKGGGYETYSVPCANGDTLSIRCEFGNCRLLQ